MDVTSALFGSIPLVRRIEAAEVRLMRAFREAAVALSHVGAFVESFAGRTRPRCATPSASSAPPLPEDIVVAEASDLETWARVAVNRFSVSEAPEGRDAAAEVHGGRGNRPGRSTHRSW
jgi:hypothetical protein